MIDKLNEKAFYWKTVKPVVKHIEQQSVTLDTWGSFGSLHTGFRESPIVGQNYVLLYTFPTQMRHLPKYDEISNFQRAAIEISLG